MLLLTEEIKSLCFSFSSHVMEEHKALYVLEQLDKQLEGKSGEEEEEEEKNGAVACSAFQQTRGGEAWLSEQEEDELQREMEIRLQDEQDSSLQQV